MNPISVKESVLNITDVDEIAFLIDTSGVIFSLNEAFSTFLQYSSEALLNKTVGDFIFSAEKHLAAKFTRKARAGIPAYGHLAFRTSKGEKRIGKITMVPFFEDSLIAGASCFVQDVTQTVISNKEAYDLEQRLEAIFYHEPDSVLVLSPNGQVIDMNPAGLLLLDTSKRLLLGTPFFTHVEEGDQEAFLAMHQQACIGTNQTLQFRLINQNRKQYWVESNTVPLRDKYGTIYATLSVIRNITEKKEIEEQLKKQEERIENTRKIAKIGYWEYDFVKQKGYATDGLYEIYGLQRSEHPEITFDVFLSLVHPEDQARMSRHIPNLILQKVVEAEHRLVRPDGSTIYVHHSGNTSCNAQGTPLYISGAVQDITERRESEKKLLLSEQKFKSLVQNGSDLIVIMDGNGVFKYISPSAKNIAGYEPEDLLEKNAFDLIHPDDQQLVTDELTSVIGAVNSGQATPHRFLNAAGEWMWLESKGVNLMHEATIKGIVINARDITDRIRLKEQLDKQSASRQRDITSAVIKAQETERSQLGQELHDNVNQVLTTIKLYNEMLLDGIGNSKDLLKKSIQHLQSCINEIRSISKRLSAPTLGKINLSDSIYELIDSINLTKKINIHCTVNSSDKLRVPQELHLTIYRIIQEQLNNILKHAEASQVSIELVNTPNAFTLSIKDDGKGFDVNMKRTGIGITNIITRAENVNGKVAIVSAPGQGCSLHLSFPPLG